MRGRVAAVVIAAVLALSALWYAMMPDEETPDVLPPDPAGRRAALLHALANEGVTGIKAQILLGQAIVETGNFTSPAFAATLSAWNRHIGDGGYGDYNGEVYMTSTGEDLRCFDSLEQCVRDMKGLLALTRYAKAKSALDAGDAKSYAVEIKAAGFATDPSYTASLISQYGALGIA